MQLCRQPPGGVDQDHIFAARLSRAHRVKAHGSGVGTILADDLYGIAVGPHAQLLSRRGTEGVCRRQQHAGTAVG